MQTKLFLKNIFWVQLINFIAKPIWIIAIDRFVQNQIGLENYGQYHLIFSLATVFFIITDLGLNNFMTKYLVANNLRSNALLNLSGGLKLILSILYLTVLISIGLSRNLDIILIIWVGANQVLLSLNQWLRVWFNVNKFFVKEALLSVIDRVVAILLWAGIFFLFQMPQGLLLYVFLGVQTMGFAIAIIITLWQIPFFNSDSEELVFKNSFKTILKSCLPFTFLAFFMAAYARLDVVLLNLLLKEGNFQIGIYAQGFRILDALNIFAALIGTMLLPIFTHIISQKNNPMMIIKSSLMVIISSIVLLLLGLHFFGEYFYLKLYSTASGLDLNYGFQVFKFVVIIYVPMSLIYIFGTYLTALGKMNYLIALAIFCFLLNLGLNLYVIPQFKALGAAKIANVTQWVFLLGCIYKTILQLKKGVHNENEIDL